MSRAQGSERGCPYISMLISGIPKRFVMVWTIVGHRLLVLFGVVDGFLKAWPPSSLEGVSL